MKKSSGAVTSGFFSGREGKKHLLAALTSQTLLAGDLALSRKVCDYGVLKEYSSGELVVTQGDYNNDLLLIVSGEVKIWVNGRNIASRAAGTHVGEMALADPRAKRSATVIAAEPSYIIRISEHRFSQLASKNPELWRRIAVELAARLRERNRFLPQPHDKPVIFIGSSAEGLKFAEAIYDYFAKKRVVPKLWTAGVFETSLTAIESLVTQTREADFAVLLPTADDMTVSRGKKKASPRDNVIFELGLFMGALGRERVVIAKPKKVDIKIPSDLFGVTWVEFARAGPKSLSDRMRPACTKILRVVKRLGAK